MRHKSKKITLDRKKAPRVAMLKNLAASVIIYEKVTTTEAKAKAVKPMVERLITVAKKGDLNARKKLIQQLPQKLAIKKMMDVLGARYKDRSGGYSRIIKIGNRQGDGAKIVQLELV